MRRFPEGRAYDSCMGDLYLREYSADVALVLPAPSNVSIGMSVRSPKTGDRYQVVRRDDATDPKTRRIVHTWWECLPV